ncbi:hypothetical protein D3C76_1323990 [compost metagenome]
MLRRTSASINCTMLAAERLADSSALARSRTSRNATMPRMAITIKTLPTITNRSERVEGVVG